MQFFQLYDKTVAQLQQAGIEDGHADAVQLFEFCFGLTRSRLFLDGAKEVSEQDLERFTEVLARRLSREPLHYITGSREFWSLDFIVSPAVLVPRPETEFVLETLLSVLRNNGYSPGTVLDMCAGSGVIAVVLAKELKSNIFAVDCSTDALQIAVQNIQRFGLENHITPVCSDLFSAIKEAEQFELIVANPPYIAEGDMDGLEPEVRDWEPEIALASGDEGTDIIKKIADQAYRYLVPGGWLFVEIGADQRTIVEELFSGHASNMYDRVKVLSDWSERPRLLQARKKEMRNG